MSSASNDSVLQHNDNNEHSFVEETSAFRLTLTLQKERLECLAEIELFPPVKQDSDEASDEATKRKTFLNPPDLLWIMNKHGMIETVDYEAVYEFCAILDMGMIPDAKVLARGIDPVAGRDGWFELLVKTSGLDACFKEDEQGNVDLRNRHAYSEIEPDQKLGLVRPPQDGVAGIDVLGVPIPAPAGKPFELIVGDGVVLKFEGRAAFATKAGRALFEKNKLSVVDLLVVPGNVDLTIGDIDFYGFVDIKGDVLDDFDIKATKGIKVAGTIGACRIESGGSIEMTSMAGKEIGTITCHGDLHATYLNQVEVQCFGHVSIENEIRNSTVKATGQITVERGAIIGGCCVGMDGIETKDMGTPSGLKTHVVAGIYFPDADRFAYLHNRLISIKQQIESINKALSPLRAHLKRGNDNAATAETRLAVLNEQLDKLYDDQNNFTAEIKASKLQSFATMNPKINIRGELREGVVLVLGQTTKEIKNARRGPMSIIENTRDGGLRFLGLTPMPVKAEKIEEELIEAENVSKKTQAAIETSENDVAD